MFWLGLTQCFRIFTVQAITIIKEELQMINNQEANRAARRDKSSHKARYAPTQGGLPRGKPKEYWLQRKAAARKSRSLVVSV